MTQNAPEKLLYFHEIIQKYFIAFNICYRRVCQALKRVFCLFAILWFQAFLQLQCLLQVHVNKGKERTGIGHQLRITAPF
jgi:hypothetical protein